MIDVPYAVKRALKDGNRPKQYRFQVLNDDETVDFVIDNDTLVKESVKIDERMCSGDRLKFGLCEGSSLEFQYFNHPNIRGRRVKVYLDVAYDNEGTEAYYPLSMGYFDIDQCSTQFSTGIIKAVGYNKLRSDYLDAKADSLIAEIQSDGQDMDDITLATIQSILLQDYEIREDQTEIIVGGNGTTGAYIESSPTFKLNNDSTLYYPRITTQYIVFRVDNTKRCKIILDDYCRKLNECIDDLKEAVFQSIQNPSSFWESFINSNGYQSECGIICSFGNTNVANASYTIKKYPVTAWVADFENTHGYIEDIKYLHGVSIIGFRFPTNLQGCINPQSPMPYVSVWETDLRASLDDMIVGEMDVDSIESIQIDKSTMSDVTLRDLVTANYELHAEYGQLDRISDLFYGVELNSGSLYPAASLYPADNLYPADDYPNNIFRPFPSEYQKLWTDSVGEQTFKYLIITYKAIEYDQQGNPTEVDKTLQRTVHEHGTTNYNCSDNWLFRNLVWTAEQVGAYADAMVEKMLNIRWFPFEMWSTGLPYVEVGDAIEIADKEGDTHISYVLQRQLNGVQNLQDTYINGQLDIF